MVGERCVELGMGTNNKGESLLSIFFVVFFLRERRKLVFASWFKLAQKEARRWITSTRISQAIGANTSGNKLLSLNLTAIVIYYMTPGCSFQISTNTLNLNRKGHNTSYLGVRLKVLKRTVRAIVSSLIFSNLFADQLKLWNYLLLEVVSLLRECALTAWHQAWILKPSSARSALRLGICVLEIQTDPTRTRVSP